MLRFFRETSISKRERGVWLMREFQAEIKQCKPGARIRAARTLSSALFRLSQSNYSYFEL